MNSERMVLLVSSFTALAMGCLGVGFALATNSRAIMLDGLYNVTYFGVGLATVRIERLTREPDSARFPFGHAYFESLVNAGKGLMILGISMIALADSVMALLSGGREIAANLAIGYALLATLLCSVTAWALRRSAGRFDSPLIDADVQNWGLNAIISLAVLLAFSLGPVFHYVGWSQAAPYIDPCLVAAVSILFLGIPVRMARQAILELLNRAPGAAIEGPVTEAIDRVLARVSVRQRHVRMVRPGRTLYVMVHVVLSADASEQGMAALDALRADIDAAVRQVHPRVLVDVLFTGDPRWAAPTAGLTAPAALPDESPGGRGS